MHYASTILRQALGDAVRDGRLDDNVAARARPPRVDPDRHTEPRALDSWDAAQAARFLELTADTPLGGLWHVALGTGMRRGELLGLRWCDVNLDTPQLRVTTSLIHTEGRPKLTSTKTGRGRVLILDDDTAAAIDHRPRPTDPAPPTPTGCSRCPTADPGGPRSSPTGGAANGPASTCPNSACTTSSHCHACLLLDQHVPIKVVAERLGHATSSTTMDIYAHVLPAQDLDATDAIERARRGQRRPGPHHRPA